MLLYSRNQYNIVKQLSSNLKHQQEIKAVYRSESESEVAQSCPTLCDPWTVAHKLLCPWDFPGKNTGVGYHFLLPDLSYPGFEPAYPSWQADSLLLSHKGKIVKY